MSAELAKGQNNHEATVTNPIKKQIVLKKEANDL
jgi:hypothetical protein